MNDLLKEIFKTLAKIASILLYILLLLFWLFKPEFINEMPTNELIVLVMLVIVGILDN